MENYRQRQAQKILDTYLPILGEDVGIQKAHFELEKYHRYGKVLFRKRSKRDRSLVYHSTITATKNFQAAKEAKQKIAEGGFKPEDVDRFINTVLTDEFVNKLKKVIDNKNSVFIPMYSSTQRNTIPAALAFKLGKKLGVEVVESNFVFATKARLEAKKLRGIDKLIHEKKYGIKYEFENNIEKYKNKKAYLIDDLFTTGQSLNSLAKTLNDHGFQVYDFINIAAASTSFTSDSDIQKMINLAVDNLGIDRGVATKKLQQLSEYSTTIGKQVYQDLNSKSKREKYKDWFNSI